MSGKVQSPLGIVVASEVEVALVLNSLKGLKRECEAGHLAILSGSFSHRPMLVAIAGVGKTNAAVAATLLFREFGTGHLVSLGIAGAYPCSGLRPGAVAVARTETYADEGCLSQNGWLDMEALSTLLVETQAGSCYNTFPLLVPEGCPYPAGPFLTLSTVTGTREASEELERRFPQALCETMEGAAVAHVAAIWGVPVTEVRGVSNMVGPRQRETWVVEEAAGNAQNALLAMVREGSL